MDDHDLLVRTASDVEHIRARVDHIGAQQDASEQKNDERYVTRHEFGPIQKIVYGMVGGVLMAVLVSILAYVVK
ncbi:MAG: hypothetical protein ACPG6R_11850 [Aequoribacter sp.]|uniref:hypothetical protein n=1 Tax=Aequoribacter sp. TaxID=2847771 RepID=UPI003C544129